jgi:hypothetical protein
MAAYGPTSEEVDAVERLALKAAQLVQEQPQSVALNALLTAYLNTAARHGVLRQVPSAAAALAQAARVLSGHDTASASTDLPSTHHH